MTNIDTQETDYSVYILACLSANVVIGIINEPRKLRLRDTLQFTIFSFRTRTFISILAYTSVNVLHQAGQLIQPVYF
jgi:hypothetical protein